MVSQSKLDRVREILAGTNVNFDIFCQKLAEFFGYDDPSKIQDEDLSCLRFEDLEDCGLPRGKARRVAHFFRDQQEDTQKIVVDISNDPEKLAASMSPVQCVDHYNPDDPSNPFGRRIGQATGLKKCLAFDADGKLHVEITKILVQEIIDGYPERSMITIDEAVGLPTYAVGEKPDRFVTENPARPGTPLSPLDDIGWDTIATNVKQLIYIAVKDTKEISQPGSFLTDSDEFDLFEKIKDKPFSQVARRFPLAAKEFRQRQAANTLPQLLIRLGATKRPNDPFHVRS